jgi:hypothetical protein
MALTLAPASAPAPSDYTNLQTLYLEECLIDMKAKVCGWLKKGLSTGFVYFTYHEDYSNLCVGKREDLQQELIKFFTSDLRYFELSLSQHSYCDAGAMHGPEKLRPREFMLVRQRHDGSSLVDGVMEHIAPSAHGIGVCVKFA